ncbi:MAG: signal peptidase I [Clostridiales bacterium]|nr:signal peptidase I [Clostridiales bacterium]
MKKESPVYTKFLIVLSLLAFIFALYVLFAISYAIGIVNGDSMNPTLKNGDVFVYAKEASIDRMNIVAIKDSESGNTIVKRIIGLPMDVIRIKNGAIYINGEKLDDVTTSYTEPGSLGDTFVLGPNEYFVIGDNRETSVDSRSFGSIRQEEILGVVIGK